MNLTPAANLNLSQVLANGSDAGAIPVSGLADLVWGGDTRLYRSAAKTLTVDDSAGGAGNLVVMGDATFEGNVGVPSGFVQANVLVGNRGVYSDAGFVNYYAGPTYLYNRSTLPVVLGASSTSATGNVVSVEIPLWLQSILAFTGSLVSALPAGSPGELDYATNGRNPGEGSGAGTGCVVEFKSAVAAWCPLGTNTPVTA